MTEYHWRIKQDGLVVAGGVAHSERQRDDAMWYYAAQYRDEGPVIYETRVKGARWKRPR